jgi:hypothetical protein
VRPNKVLIISNPDDEHTKVVVDKIVDLGATPLLLHPEDLGQTIVAGSHLLPTQFTPQYTLELETGHIDPETVQSVWYRRPRTASLIAQRLDVQGISFARDEWRAYLEAMYALICQPLWVSHPDRLREAARKPVQLALARQLGLAVPHTLVTNDPCCAREFFECYDGRIIAKPTGAGWIYTQDKSAVTYVLTNRVSSIDLEAEAELRVAPVTFQEEVPKAYEVRANVVGQEVLAIRIDSQGSDISQVDWRRYDIERTPYTPYCLPLEIEERLLRLTRMVGLEYGAIDLIRRPDGQYVFLEINGNGQFLWAEKLSGVNVSGALARLLSGAAPPLQSANVL